MKKLISGLAIVMAVSAIHAASINWSISGSSTLVTKDYSGNAYASTVYFVLADDLTSITSSTQNKETFLSELSGLTLATASTSDGKKPSVTEMPVTSDSLVAGKSTNFALLIVSEDADGNGYYKTVTAYANPYVTGSAADAQVEVRTAWNLNNKTWVQGYAAQEPDPGPGGDDPTPSVPEPATGALAIAGLTLLFRRRRA